MSEGIRIRQRSGASTSPGPRADNQDWFHLQDLPVDGVSGMALVAIADGMGGHAAGGMASRTAVDVAVSEIQRGALQTSGMEGVFATSDHEVRATAAAHGLSGMGTTLTVAVVRNGEAVIGHVGDTRAYIFNGGALTQITEDHSKVGRLVRDQVLTEEQAMGHPEQNVLERALGVGSDSTPDIYRVGLGPGDVLLMSTDGLHGVVPRPEIAGILRSTSSLQEACDQLVAMAEAWGTDDNVTAVAWEYPASSAAHGATLIGFKPNLRTAPSAHATVTGVAGDGNGFLVLALLVVTFIFACGIGWLLGEIL